MSISPITHNDVFADFGERLEALNSSSNSNNDMFDSDWQSTDGSTVLFNGSKILRESSEFFSQNHIKPNYLIKYLIVRLYPKNKSDSTIRTMLHFLVILFHYMQERDIITLRQEDMKELFRSYLMSKISLPSQHDRTYVVERLIPRSAGTCHFLPTIIQQITNILLPFGISLSNLHNVSPKRMERTLKASFEEASLGEVTYKDWKKGKTFNNLTLDYGRHYIEFLQDFYEENYPIALAIKHIISKRDDLLKQVGYVSYKDTHRLVNALCTQEPLENIHKANKLCPIKVSKLKTLIEIEYKTFIMPILQAQYILKEENVARIAALVGSPVDRDQMFPLAEVERLRNILYFILSGNELPNFELIVRNSNFTADITRIKKVIETIKAELPEAQLPTYDRIAKYSGEYFDRISSQPHTKFLRNVHNAGVTCIVAFTGWRASEYGFPYSAISSLTNHDIIDQYALPFRHNVHWHIFKTQKGAPLDREITQKTFELIMSVSRFSDHSNNKPAIYNAIYDQNVKHEQTGKVFSSNKITSSIKSNWYNFSQHYKPFTVLKEVDEYESLLRSNKKLTDSEQLHFYNLSKKVGSDEWLYAYENTNLRETYERVQSELPIVSFHSDSKGVGAKKDTLLEYQKYLNREKYNIHSEILELYEDTLDEAIKNKVKNSDLVTLSNLNLEINSFLLEDALYPTPHALRHMWAEAVFRRFDGDAGWMIRSNFKHISESMWLAYIANKFSLPEVNRLRVKISSSLMKKWLRNKGAKTSGKYHHFLRRLFKNTDITSLDALEEADSLINKIASEDVISLKANPWGYCINRLSTSSLAKCAQDGEAKPHNASPDLCMNCINFMTCDANIDYIIEHSLQHVDLLNSEHLATIPQVLVNPSITYVSSARKRIADIDPAHKILKQYDSALAKAV